MQKLIAICALSIITSTSYASSAKTVVQNAVGKNGTTIKVFAQFTYKIDNPTNTIQNYIGEEKIEVKGQAWRRNFLLSIPAHGKYQKSETAILNYKANQVGTFESNAYVTIVGNVGASHFATGKVIVNP